MQGAGENVAPPGYILLARVAEGTYSDLWQVRHIASRELYALKILRERWRNDADVRRLWAHEMHVGRTVRSRRVVPVLGGRLETRQPDMLLEWIDGSTLEDRLGEQGRLSIAAALWIARQCAEGLADLAEAGFSHGDLKPSNVLVTPAGEVKLIDLGFAVPIAQRASKSAPLMTGTPEYMAPERLSREPVNPITADFYSLGVVLYRMLAGRLPFRAETVEHVLRQQRQAKPPQLSRWAPSAPPELIGLVRRLLAKHPLRRPQTPARLVRELVDLELAMFPERSPRRFLPPPHHGVDTAHGAGTIP